MRVRMPHPGEATDCPNRINVGTMGMADPNHVFVCGCPMEEWPVDLTKDAATPLFGDWTPRWADEGRPRPEPVNVSDFTSVHVKKIAAVIPVSAEVLADYEDGGQTVPTAARKVAWHRRLRTRLNWYNFRCVVGSWILPWDPHEE